MIEKIATAMGSRTLPFGPQPADGGGGGAGVVSVMVVPSRSGVCRSPGTRFARTAVERADPQWSGVDFAPALERPAEGDLVGVLQVPAHGEAAGDAGDPYPERLEQPGEVHGR